MITGAFGAMYLKSAWDIIRTHEIAFVHYTASSPGEVWTARNLGIRVLAIGIGMVLAAFGRDLRVLAVMLGVRLVADTGDLINSAVTPSAEGYVVPVLGVFVALELVALVLVVLATRARGTSEPRGSRQANEHEPRP